MNAIGALNERKARRRVARAVQVPTASVPVQSAIPSTSSTNALAAARAPAPSPASIACTTVAASALAATAIGATVGASVRITALVGRSAQPLVVDGSRRSHPPTPGPRSRCDLRHGTLKRSLGFRVVSISLRNGAMPLAARRRGRARFSAWRYRNWRRFPPAEVSIAGIESSVNRRDLQLLQRIHLGQIGDGPCRGTILPAVRWPGDRIVGHGGPNEKETAVSE